MGMINFGAELGSKESFARSSFGYIMNDIEDLKDRYIRLGFHLDEFNRNEYYKCFGYSDFKEFCNENMPLAYSTIMKCIQVFYQFAHQDGNIRKMYIDDKYKDFSFSQLSEMLPIDSRRREIIKPDWSCEKIRRYKKGLKKNRAEVDPVVEEDVSSCNENETNHEEIFSQVLSSDNAMKLLLDALKKKFGNDCMDSYRLTSSSIVFNCCNEKYRLQLNKLK